MNKNQAQRIIKDTFENKFEKNRFTRFIVELLNLKSSAVNEAAVMFNKNQVPNAYQPFISSFEKIADYRSGEHKLDVLAIWLKKETSIERARTMQRNFVAWHLRGDYGGEMKDAALAAFISPDGKDWRFSLVKIDYSLGEDKKGRVKISEEFTPAKRWSFLVGSNENSHTAQRQLIDILAKDEINPTLTQLEESFNIETVTKEFFKKYRELFFWTKETLDKILDKDSKVRSDFETKNINTTDFSKKLLGQIVFLYFLQKKGWFGVARDADWGTGPKNFLRELFKGKHGKYNNFFNDILEPLFYEALRNDRSYDDDYYKLFNCKIPFLNGGLFDPINNYNWVRTDINLPNELFSNEIITKEGDKGTGILDVFDRYNFTVKEDEPLEKEVAVDPEMLGKVFENLLKVKDRKSKGTYYTPREIVHYMCQQSLINYLDTEMEEKVSKDDIEKLIKYGEQFEENSTDLIDSLKDIPESIVWNAKLIDEKLADIKVCDPAVGSGAFLVGMMGEIVRTRNVLSNYIKGKNKTVYDFKRDCIENSLYGVDIDPGAVEIAKLRLWLSLVVDEEDIKQIKPLPNLDYKIVCGNSLMSIEKNLFNHELFSELESLKKIFFDEINPNKKKELKEKINETISKITNGHKEFDFEIYFSEVFHYKKGFDVVIGNPPYGFRNVLTHEEKKYYREIERISFSSGDSAELFVKKSFINLVKNNGILTFIIPKKSLYGDSWENLRESFWKKYSLAFLLDASKVFEKVLLEANAFGLIKTEKNKKIVKLLFLNKNNEVEEFSRVNSDDIFLENKTAQIYRFKFSEELLSKIYSLSKIGGFVKGVLGLAIGTEFFSDTPTDYKLLKGIDIERWSIKGKRFLCNKDKLNWQNARLFLKPKVISQVIVAHIENPIPHLKITACYDSEGIIITNTLMSFELNGIDEKFWLGYLNSAFLSWYAYNFIYARAIRTMHFYDFYIQQIPIPKIIINNYEIQKPVIDLVNKIINLTDNKEYIKYNEKNSLVKEYENQLDQLIYQFYNLKSHEVEIIKKG